ncbi:MAG: hypothetical protein WCG47_26035 [Dermatophilaceae bacterium]
MSPTTFDDLLTEAEAVLTDLADRRTLDAAGMAGGWQVFARRAVHAIAAATRDRDSSGERVGRARGCRLPGRCRSSPGGCPPGPGCGL